LQALHKHTMPLMDRLFKHVKMDNQGVRGCLSCKADRRGSPFYLVTDNNINQMPHKDKDGCSEHYFGPMWLRQHPMSILMVFAKETSVSEHIREAAERGGFTMTSRRGAEPALEAYLEEMHDVVLVDTRHSKHLDAEALCRSMRAVKSSEHTVIIAITKRNDRDDSSVLPLLNAGYNRRIIEPSNVQECLNELICIEHSDHKHQVELRAAKALMTAVEATSEPIEITNQDSEVEYVNPAHERLFGHSCEELYGKSNKNEECENDKHKAESIDSMTQQLRKGKTWEGVNYGKRKTGETICYHCRAMPVLGHAGSVQHFVSVKKLKNDNHNNINNAEISFASDSVYTNNMYRRGRRGSTPPGVHGFRRDSYPRLNSITVEAPITKVINIINSAQENSPVMVATALERVLDILRSSELYSPYFGPNVKDDQMTNDLVGGIMTTQPSIKRKFSQDFKQAHLLTSEVQFPVPIPPDVKDILETDNLWSFDVIELERLTNNRPLQYLGLAVFERFRIPELLNCPEKTLFYWLQMIEANYHASNPYHNSTHAADVLQATAYFLQTQRLKNIMEPMDEAAALIAATVHDLNHPGRTNSYLVNSGSELAVLYNDIAVLESHHVSLAFSLTSKDERVDLFKSMDKEEYRCIRQAVIDLVLATDMSKHFEHLNKFSGIVHFKPGKAEDENESMVSQLSGCGNNSSINFQTSENRTLIKRILIKCADVCNPLRPLHICKEWARRIADEYCCQTDDEIKKGLPVVMPIFNRKTINVPKSQTSFIDFFINDMFDTWDVFVDVGDLMTCLNENYTYWKEQEEKQQLEKQQQEQQVPLPGETTEDC